VNIASDIFISICIPAYKRAEFLKRLLDSINNQSFRNFEVVLSDDSPDNSIELLCENYSKYFNIRYFKNATQLGTPENWNEAIRHANGEWLKLMHDDDWFTSEHSLSSFADAIANNPSATFLFSAYRNYYFEHSNYKNVSVSKWWLIQMRKNPVVLFSKNIIGAPSVTILKRSMGVVYDKNLKWLVDIDYYIRVLSTAKPFYIDKVILDIGIGKEQVTQDCFRQRPVEIPENFYLLEKVGTEQLKNIIVYDAWWRLMRNLEIKNSTEIIESGFTGVIPVVILKMIKFQKLIPSHILKKGVFSKILMSVSYILNYGRIN
jgi:glycosyltransferase involved in cell wall biosynthesis